MLVNRLTTILPRMDGLHIKMADPPENLGGRKVKEMTGRNECNPHPQNEPLSMNELASPMPE